MLRQRLLSWKRISKMKSKTRRLNQTAGFNDSGRSLNWPEIRTSGYEMRCLARNQLQGMGSSEQDDRIRQAERARDEAMVEAQFL